jgi:predicted glycogen debranching enzyme
MPLHQQQIELGFSLGHDDVEISGATEAPEKVLRSMGVELTPDRGREFVYTDKAKARWSGETHRHNTSIYHGLSTEMRKCVEDWVLALGDARLSPPDAGKVVVYPHKLVRYYDAEKSREEVFFCDGIGALVSLYTTEFRGNFRFAPRFDLRHMWKPGRYPYRVTWDTEHNLLLVTNPKVGEDADSPSVWVGVSASEPMMFVEKAAYYPIVYPQDERRGVMKEATPYQAGLLKGRVKSGRIAFVMAVGDSEDQVRDSVRQALFRRQEYYVERSARLSRLVDRAAGGTGDEPLEQALRWAALSLDSLAMNQQGRGIYAGLPWFPNYWSRDTFISLPALLCLGQFKECREILLAAAEGQCGDFRSPYYGRLPNLVSPGEEALYNTADGTWWFVLAAHAYVRYTGDTSFAHEILSYLIRAIEGEAKKRCDGERLSVHGDAETWMDATLEGKPWTPRGNRAVEIQVLWHAALMAAADVAGWAGEKGLSEEWRRLGAGIAEVFLREFWDSGSGCLFDHLNEDGSADRQARPNQIFALLARPASLLSFEQEEPVLDCVLDQVVFPHGVGSLAPEDPEFCPRHIDLEHYPFDQAYHNGDVWVWLSGPVISALVRHGRVETAWAMIRTLVDLTREGAVGTLPELRNAVPSPGGEPNIEGTVSQAWSLAEFIRPFYQDIMGLQPDMMNRRLTIEPALPGSLPGLEFTQKLGDVELHGRFEVGKDERRYRFELAGSGEAVILNLRVRVPGARVLVAETRLEPAGTAEFVASPDGDDWRMTLNGDPVSFEIESTPFDIAKETVPVFRVPAGTKTES